MPIAQTLLTIHTFYDLPREMQQLDPRREQIELVVRPVVRYDYQERHITFLKLNERVLPFSSSSILFKGGRLVVDLGSPASPNASTGGTLQCASPRDAPCPRWRPAAEEEASEEGGGDGDDTPRRGVMKGNQILLQYPSPRGLSTLIDVMVGMRQHRLGSSLVRWITSTLDTSTPSNGVGYFTVATEEIRRKKSVTRTVGLNVGGVIFSASVNPGDDQDCILERLMQDKNRYLGSYGNNELLAKVDVAAMLREGLSEEEIHRHMRLLVDPDYYVRRLENLLTLYPSYAGAEWRQSGILLQNYASREEELMRRAILEIGPECATVSARLRFLAYRKKHLLSDQSILACLQSVLKGDINETLVNEPEAIFEVLTKNFGKEPRPSSYLFPVQTYTPDRRTFFFETLHVPVNRTGEKHREMTLASRSKRTPFTMSPCERPLHFGTSSGRSIEAPSEIEILREKYSPEFAQIVPCIANALQAVVEQNRKLVHAAAADASFVIFQQQGAKLQLSFQDFVHRTAEYTFISPSSLLGAVIYLDRLCLHHPNLILTERNILRLFLTSVRVASKTMELRSVNNRHFAEVFGLETKSLNLMEEVFIKQLMFDFFLSPEEFGDYARLLQSPNAYQLRALSTHRAFAATCETAVKAPLSPQETQRRYGATIISAENLRAANQAGSDRQANIREHVVDVKESAGNAVINGAQVASCAEGVEKNERANGAGASPKKLAGGGSGSGGHGLNCIGVSNNNNTATTVGDSNGDASRAIVGGLSQADRKHKLVV
ncbi:putative cyclin 11 [Trypanosoma conorhini]|uniref:Putative cyclin 11 n=1 Tax=Trypanosoma conorhini TaxID=83891 RepID=A0A3R7N1V8_9TRYP|nr:putative cyclin 11 [Trypanosoma conorhini]RNF14628.1 putative cyclin 11 [Trypanosoma conorhini]